MTADMVISQAAAEATLNALTALIDVGGTGTVKVFTGSAPSNCGVADSGTLLMTFTMPATTFGAAGATGVADAIATANAITAVTAVATNTAGYFRAYNHAGTCVLQGVIGTSSADFVISSTTITSGNSYGITSWTITMPANGT